MSRPIPARGAAAVLALALGAVLVGGCEPGGEYGYDRVSHRQWPPRVPQATNPEPPAARPGLLASAEKKELDLSNLPPGITAAMVEQGQELFAVPCAACHGPGGAGTPAAPPLNDSQWLNVSGAFPEIVTVINEGVPQPREYSGGMPPKGGGSFDDAQVRALAAYVYALSHQGEQ